MISSPNASLIISSASVALFPIFAQNFMHTRCWINRNSKQQVRKKSVHPLSCVKLCTLTPNIYYHLLVQLLNKWLQQSWKLWIPHIYLILHLWFTDASRKIIKYCVKCYRGTPKQLPSI
jgi:hypothetical protein